MDTKKLRQKILDLAIHGKLVPQDPNDEPASVLLERIKAEKEQLIKEGKIKRIKKTTTCDTPHYGNVSFEVPEGWKTVTMSDIFLLNPKNDLDDNLKCGFIPMALVTDGFIGKHTFETRKWSEIKNGFCHFQNGDIGIAKISPCFENLKSVIFKSLPNNYGAGTTELTILRSITVNAEFYLYLFKSQWYINEGTKYFKGVVGQQRVNKSIFTDLCVPLPPLSEQERIVEEIETWFTWIDIIESKKSDLKIEIKKTKSKILDLAIHGKLVPQDPNDEPAIELLKRINPDFTPCDNSHYTYNLPNSWIWILLNDIFDISSAKRILKSDWKTNGIPFYRAREIAKLSQFGFVENELFISKEQYEEIQMQYGVPMENDIMLTAVGTIGKPYIVKYDDIFYYKDASVIRLHLKTDLRYNPIYFKLLFSTQFVIKQMNDNSKGTTVDTITIEKAKCYTVPFPPLAEQQRIIQKVKELFSTLDTIQKSLEA